MSTADSALERPLRVLLADDHPTNRAVVEVILGLIECELTAVEDGAQAVDAYKAGDYDVVLMDLQMPVMDGLTAIREIRAYEAGTNRGHTPILAVTANAMSEHIAASREAGADRHIAKPVIPDGLLNAIAEAVSTSAAAPDAQRAVG